MISFEKARELILSQTASFGKETISLDNVLGRILAEDVFASRDFPPFNRSAMDGIALRFEDLQNHIQNFRCVETIFAGDLHAKDLKAGECYKIMTGAAVPSCADVVIRVEDITEDKDIIRVLTTEFKQHQNIASKGQDLKMNELVLKKGTIINVATVGLLASLGKQTIKVQRLPTVNIITTGNEVVELGEKASTVQIYNSNKYVLKSLLKQQDIDTNAYVHVKDDIAELSNAIFNNLNADVLIITGGVSAGEADYIPQIMGELKVEKLFHKVAIKPGKPIWCGKRNQTMVFALPGNPFSCLVTFKLFVEFYIRTCLGLSAKDPQTLPVNFNRLKKSDLDEFFPVYLKNGWLNKIDINGSGDIRLGFSANALAQQVAIQKEIKKGIAAPYFTL